MKNIVFSSIISDYMVSEPGAKKWKKERLIWSFYGRALEGCRRGVLKHHFRFVVDTTTTSRSAALRLVCPRNSASGKSICEAHAPPLS